MSDAVDVQDEVGAGSQERPTILPPPTTPAAFLADDPGQEPAPPPPPPASAEKPAQPYLLIRLGHRLCGFRR